MKLQAKHLGHPRGRISQSDPTSAWIHLLWRSFQKNGQFFLPLWHCLEVGLLRLRSIVTESLHGIPRSAWTLNSQTYKKEPSSIIPRLAHNSSTMVESHLLKNLDGITNLGKVYCSGHVGMNEKGSLAALRPLHVMDGLPWASFVFLHPKILRLTQLDRALLIVVALIFGALTGPAGVVRRNRFLHAWYEQILPHGKIRSALHVTIRACFMCIVAFSFVRVELCSAKRHGCERILSSFYPLSLHLEATKWWRKVNCNVCIGAHTHTHRYVEKTALDFVVPSNLATAHIFVAILQRTLPDQRNNHWDNPGELQWKKNVLLRNENKMKLNIQHITFSITTIVKGQNLSFPTKENKQELGTNITSKCLLRTEQGTHHEGSGEKRLDVLFQPERPDAPNTILAANKARFFFQKRASRELDVWLTLSWTAISSCRTPTLDVTWLGRNCVHEKSKHTSPANLLCNGCNSLNSKCLTLKRIRQSPEPLKEDMRRAICAQSNKRREPLWQPYCALVIQISTATRPMHVCFTTDLHNHQ